METKDRNDELMELKNQMECLKKHLHEQEIVDEHQIAEISRTYKPKHYKLKALLGALAGLAICFCHFSSSLFNYEETLAVWEIVLFVAIVLFYMFWYMIMLSGNSYEIEENHLIVRNVFRQKGFDIAIDKIRVIEFMANKSLGARILYNKFDDFYLRRVNYTELIQEILRINPDIEIRRELA